jgi:hypothetical protein
VRRNVIFAVSLIVAPSFGACDGDNRNATPQDAIDSLGTTRELRATLAGEPAPGAQSYSYRGLYAGMPRARLERALRISSLPDSSCAQLPGGKVLQCHYESVVGPDSAQLSLDATYDKPEDGMNAAAHIIVATRALPLDVDGVALARRLGDAFEKQTSLLDKRDATYGSNRAQVRMGTVNGARQNFVDVDVETKNGREVLTVKLSRAGAAPKK